jgi:hypothetical protein
MWCVHAAVALIGTLLSRMWCVHAAVALIGTLLSRMWCVHAAVALIGTLSSQKWCVHPGVVIVGTCFPRCGLSLLCRSSWDPVFPDVACPFWCCSCCKATVEGHSLFTCICDLLSKICLGLV